MHCLSVVLHLPLSSCAASISPQNGFNEILGTLTLVIPSSAASSTFTAPPPIVPALCSRYNNRGNRLFCLATFVEQCLAICPKAHTDTQSNSYSSSSSLSHTMSANVFIASQDIKQVASCAQCPAIYLKTIEYI